MNDRQRFIAAMHYQPRDRAPLYDFSFWAETLPAWHPQGLPATVNTRNAADFFGLDCSLFGGEGPDWGTGVAGDLNPGFETKILEDDGDVYTQM